MKTRADFFRDAKTGTMSMLMTLRDGKTLKELRQGGRYLNERIERLMTTWRMVTKIQTNSIALEGSFLDLPLASLMEYDGSQLKVYAAGYRDLNDQEQAIMKEWEEVAKTPEYQQQSNYDIMTDCSTTYYQEKRFFDRKGFPYLFGAAESQGLKKVNTIYNDVYGTYIRDNSIKGDLLFVYSVKFN